jgi:hypothetical protein
VADLDKKLQALHPVPLSKLVCVEESALGLSLNLGIQFGAAVADIVVTSGLPSNRFPALTNGHIITSCNGVPVQSKADFYRALQFSDASAMLVVVPAASVDRNAPLAAPWTRSEMRGGRVQYTNTLTLHTTCLHPHLLMKETVQVLFTLSSYKNGQRDQNPFPLPALHPF